MRPTFHLSHACCLAITLLFGAGTIGCGDDSGDGTGASGPTSTGTTGNGGSGGGVGGGGGAGGGTGGSGNTGGEAPECPGPGFSGGEIDMMPDSVDATILDETGQPVANKQVELCGINLCLYGTTNAQGFATVSGGGQTLTQPAFKYGNGLEYAKLGVLLTAPTTSLGDLTTARLPATGAALADSFDRDGGAYSTGGDVTSGDVTLKIAPDTYIVVDTLLFMSPEMQQFRAARVPLTADSPVLDPALNLELVYGVGPIETLFCPAVGVVIPNELGWPADAEVEFYYFGLSIGQEYAEYANWSKASDGKVSADGMTIETAAGGGFLELTTFGVRLKP